VTGSTSVDVRQIAEGARALVTALDRSAADRAVAEAELEQVALAWASKADATPGFAGGREPGVEQPPEERLAAIAEDLDVAQLLLAAGLATGEVADDGGGRPLLVSSIARLEDEADALRRSGGADAGFTGARAAGDLARGPVVGVEACQQAVGTVVDGTLTVLEEAWQRLRELPPDVAVKALEAAGAVLDVAPQVGRFVRMGLQAIKRALLALLELLPAKAKDAVRNQARAWWAESGDDVRRTVVARLLSAQEAEVSLTRDQLTGVPEAELGRALDRLALLTSRFQGVVETFGRVLRALAAAVAIATVVAVVVAAVAMWVPLAAAAGYALAAGSVIVLARDYLDTGSPMARVDGVQSILSDIRRS